MNKNLIVILDCSGSFAENGKLEILRAFRLTAARVSKSFGVNSDFFIWREDVQPLNNPKDVVPKGTSDILALKKFLETCPAGAKILLLSDGAWDIDDCPKIKSALVAKELVFVAIGADANRAANYNISTVGGIWTPADLPAAIQTLLFGGAS